MARTKTLDTLKADADRRATWRKERRDNPIRPVTLSPPKDLGDGYWLIDGVILPESCLPMRV